MSQSLEETIRSEEESVLSAPVNVISDDDLDCGCKQLQFPRLVKYATRPVYVTILCLIGTLQGAAHAYILVTSLTVSRRFNIDYIAMDWVLGIFNITTFLGGLVFAYWGDRIHKASWTGALVLLQSICFLTFLIPQFTHANKTIEEPTANTNSTHMSIYAEDSPNICIKEGSARIISNENDTCYFTLFIFAVAQFLSGLANVAYYALGISYLDDNTRRKNAASYIGLIVAVQFWGILFGSLLAWSFLKIDADNFNTVESYREQIGAWWIGWPIIATLLAIPAFTLAIFPRQLVTEVIEQAAGEILNGFNVHRNYNLSTQKVDSNRFLPSILRLLKNKIFILNVASAAFCSMAIYNFLLNENLLLESKFYAPRPNNLFLGFNDPIVSRAITNIFKPLAAGLAIIVSGLVISKIKPKAIFLGAYSFSVIFITVIIIFSLAFNNCDKRPIADDKSNHLDLMKNCNRDCRCTQDADFRPICDRNGMFTFYNACYAGCSKTNVTKGTRHYDDCKCIEEMTGQGNFEATEGSCDLDNCQTSWIIFEIFTTIAYTLIASSIVGDFVINLRNLHAQDKALAIAFWLSCMAFFIQIPGKLIYKAFADSTCKHWGLDMQTCRFHSDNYGSYICFVTSSFLLIGAIFKSLVCYFCKPLELYEIVDEEKQGIELIDVTRTQSEPLLGPQPPSASDVEEIKTDQQVNIAEETVVEKPKLVKVNQLQSSSLKHDPLEPGGSKSVTICEISIPNSLYVSLSKSKKKADDADSSSDDSNVFSKSPGSKVSYKPLELDSDTENDLGAYGPRSRKRIPSKTDEQSPVDEFRPLPNPDNYEDPRRARGYQMMTNETQNPPKEHEKLLKSSELNQSQGDFNEVGIPIVDIYESRSRLAINKSHDSIVMCQFNTINDHDKFRGGKLIRSMDDMQVPFDMEKTYHLLTEKFVRPPSRDQESSGFGSLQNVSDSTRQSIRRHGSKESLSSKTSASTSESQSKGHPITTDL